MSTCSVVMVTHHTGPVLFAAIRSVLLQEQLAELIVVDNGNPPDVRARLQQMGLMDPRMRIVISPGNIGFSKACNVGAEQASGEFILLLNPECLLPPGALADTMRALKDVPQAMLAGCRLENPDGSEEEGSRRVLPTPKSIFKNVLGLKHWKFRRGEAPVQSDTHEVPAVSGAFMCIRRVDYNQLQGLDENFFHYGAGLDLCMRVRTRAGKVICVLGVAVTHMPGGAASGFVLWQKTKGLIRYFDKHGRKKYFPGVLSLTKAAMMLRFAYDIHVAALRTNFRREPVMEHSVAAKRLMILASGLADLPDDQILEGTTVLVTGATSQVGLCVVRRLLAAGASVLAISRADPIPFRHAQLRWIKGDLTDQRLNLEGYLADVVVHCAPLWHLPPTIDLLATAEVKRIIALGSTSVFAKALSKNDQERDLVFKLTVAEAEIIERCQAKKIHWTILRPTMIYGVGLDLSITSLAKFIHRAGFFPVYPPAFGQRQPVHADDLAIAVVQAMNKKKTADKSYNLSGGEILTYRVMLERIFAVCRQKPRIIETTLLPFLLDMGGWLMRRHHINGEVARRMNDDLIFFHDEAKKDFDFKPRAFLGGGIKDIEGF